MEMKEILMKEYNYPDYGADIIIKELSSLNPQVTPILERWKETRNEEDGQLFHDWSINLLREELGYNFFGALLTLDCVIKDPDETLPFLEKDKYIIAKNNE